MTLLETEIKTEIDAMVSARRVRLAAQEMAYSTVGQTMLNTAVLEVTRNIIKYAEQGWLQALRVDDEAKTGLCVIVVDQGPGIADVELAMQDGYSTGQSLGLGLPGARRLMDVFEIESIVGRGTRIRMTKWRI